jgi:Fe-S-cluster-containing dehydrogenase component
MSRYGLLIDYEFCTGCHSCEMACKQEHSLPAGKWGIQIIQSGPTKLEEDKWLYDYIPVPTQLCDLCSALVKSGSQPACVRHCQSGVMKYGTVEELAKFMEIKPGTVLFAPC